MALKTARLYWHALDDVLFRPDRGGVPRSCLTLKRGDLVLIEVHAVNTYDFTLESGGTAPSAARWSLAEYADGTPVFAIKTESKFAADDDFEEAWSGFYSQSLSAGKFVMAVAPSASFDPDELHCGGFELRGASDNVLEIPGRALHLDVARDVYLGTESDAPVAGVSAFSGLATITAGNTYVDITISGLTASAVVVAGLMGTSADWIFPALTPTTDNLRVSILAPAVGTQIYSYRVVSL